MSQPPQRSIKISRPVKTTPALRLGPKADQARQKKAEAQEKQAAEARIRVQIYRDLLALLDIAERLTMDLSSHQDRYGIEWNSLARKIMAHYNADLFDLIPAIQNKVMSKEGAHGLPKGLYRNLLDFAGECDNFLKSARAINELAPDAQETEFANACEHFKQVCADMRQQICIFENERPPDEESFFE